MRGGAMTGVWIGAAVLFVSVAAVLVIAMRK